MLHCRLARTHLGTKLSSAIEPLRVQYRVHPGCTLPAAVQHDVDVDRSAVLGLEHARQVGVGRAGMRKTDWWTVGTTVLPCAVISPLPRASKVSGTTRSLRRGARRPICIS
jgi:hypothetical protein